MAFVHTCSAANVLTFLFYFIFIDEVFPKSNVTMNENKRLLFFFFFKYSRKAH